MANKKNLANGVLSAGINTSATTLTVSTGHGARFPATPFFATLTPYGVLSTPDNSEIVSVTGISTDTLTIVRAQKSTTAKSFVTNDIIANGIYAEDLSALVADAINDGTTDIAPSQNAVFDALALKLDTATFQMLSSGLKDFLSSGGVWAQTSGLAGGGASGTVFYAGQKYSMGATTKTFTASKDTYIDYNPTAATWTYVEVAINADFPAITASCVRVGLVTTNGSAITAVYQTPYKSPLYYSGSIVDGYITSNQANDASGNRMFAFLDCDIPFYRKHIRVEITGGNYFTAGASSANYGVNVWTSPDNSTWTQITAQAFANAGVNTNMPMTSIAYIKPPVGKHLYFRWGIFGPNNSGNVWTGNTSAPIVHQISGE